MWRAIRRRQHSNHGVLGELYRSLTFRLMRHAFAYYQPV